ncbi:polysaccharide deacetylase family protein [Pseudomonas sp. SH1-B]
MSLLSKEPLPLEVVVTIDDMLIWDGSPLPPGYTREGIVTSLIQTLAKHQIGGVYGFAHTSLLDQDRGLKELLEHWVDSGHHLGNHTHCHACLNWVSAKSYCEDIKRSEDVIGDLIEKAPSRYFRYAMDMTSPSEAKRGEVEDFLALNGYRNAPVTAWFGDFAWIVPYARALMNKDMASVQALRTSYVNAAVMMLHNHSKMARRIFGRDIPYIWLIHGTAIAMDAMDDILSAFKDLGVKFVTLDHAMKDVVHRTMPPVSPKFLNHLQRFALTQDFDLDGVPLEQMREVLEASPIAGMESFAVYDDVLRKMCERAGGTFEWDWS